MQKLEKILEEIKGVFEQNIVKELNGDGTDDKYSLNPWHTWKDIEEVIRKHMNGGWVSVKEFELPSGLEHDFRFWITIQYKNGYRRTLKATWNYFDKCFMHQNGRKVVEDVVAYKHYCEPDPYQPEENSYLEEKR